MIGVYNFYYKKMRNIKVKSGMATF